MAICTVHALSAHAAALPSSSTPPVAATTTTGVDGRYQMDVASGAYQLSVAHDGFQETSRALESHGSPGGHDFDLSGHVDPFTRME